MVFFAFLSISVQAKELYYKEMTFTQYVNLKCSSRCADPKALLNGVKLLAKQRNLDFKRLLAIIAVESSFKTQAVNGGSVGVMQVNLKYHKKKFRQNPYNVWDNIRVGSSIYKACVTRHKGNARKALWCYNGEGDKTFKYPLMVFKAYDQISQLKDLK